ncbi:DUF3618 domain-containing protein [Pseudooceanicola sp.]|uniref:DUF3618 domain-containing protein n=1 Tax=Pseudooceanicola sp. TaxID=1914328 RepID=UPI00405A3E62
MSDNRTPDEIERDIERERAELGATVDELQDRFSADRILRELGRGLSDHGQDIGEAVSQSVKRNPVALALTGIGLAWLMSGRSWEEDRDAVMPSARREPAPLPTRPTYPAAETYRSPPATDPYGARAYDAHDDWLWADEDDYWDDHDEDDGPGLGERMSDAGARAGEKTKAGAASVGSRVSSGASAARRGVSDGAASVRDSASAAGHSAADRARRIRRRLSHGTESLSEEARERVVAARWNAVKARRAAARRARKGADAATDFFEENPLVVGGLALAAGAILAGTLPRTRQEDAYFGEYSDRAYDRAERAFDAERRKAMKVADRAAATAQEVMAEERAKIDEQAPGDKSAAEHVADEVRGGAAKVAEATRDEAKKQKLGQGES